MAKASGSQKPSGERVRSLIEALADKGTPGLILLSIIFLTIWAPVWPIAFKLFKFFGVAKDLPGISSLAPVAIGVFIGLLAAGYVFLAYRLTARILLTMIPTIRAEAEAAMLMSEALGGRVVTAFGTRKTLAIDPTGAQTRTRQIMSALLERARRVLGLEVLRSNIFVLREDGKLRILDGLHLNMKGRTLDDRELTIAIPNGLLSSGWAFKYFRPVLSVKGENGKWPYAFDAEANNLELEAEIQKAHPDLKWIVSMPIPYQIRPFRLTCGVLNVDGLEGLPTREQLGALLADLSTAAALIAVLNRSTGFLDGEYSKPSELTDAEQEQLKRYLISPEEFDPASCPEPSREFVLALANIRGLEFFGRISETDVANFLRDQLGS